MVESMHEHSFNFISQVLIGEMENQCYSVEPLSRAEEAFSARLQAHLKTVSAAHQSAANEQLEFLEAMRLFFLGSNQFIDDLALKRVTGSLASTLGLGANAGREIAMAVGLQGRYQSVASSVEGGQYVHRLTEMVNLKPYRVLALKAGDTYHHPHQFAHRLYIKAGQPNATMIVTTPVSQTAIGGSFQRPTWVDESDINYDRRMYTAEELYAALAKFRSQLSAHEGADAGRLLDVGDDSD